MVINYIYIQQIIYKGVFIMFKNLSNTELQQVNGGRWSDKLSPDTVSTLRKYFERALAELSKRY